MSVLSPAAWLAGMGLTPLSLDHAGFGLVTKPMLTMLIFQLQLNCAGTAPRASLLLRIIHVCFVSCYHSIAALQPFLQCQ